MPISNVLNPHTTVMVNTGYQLDRNKSDLGDESKQYLD